MKGLANIVKKRWVWGIFVFVLCMGAFLGVMNARNRETAHAAMSYTFADSSGNTVGSGYTMRRTTDTFTITPAGDYQSITQYTWKSLNESILKVSSGSDTSTATLEVVGEETGSVSIQVTVGYKDETGNNVTETVSMTVTVAFSISEYLNTTANNAGSYITKVYNTDERSALVMEYGAVLSIGDASADESHLKLIFGDGTAATWSSSNEDVIMYSNENENGPMLQAVGAGTATLTVQYYDGSQTLTDSIAVYVKPEIRDTDVNGEVLAGGTTMINQTGGVTVENGDKLYVTVLSNDKPQYAIGDKIVWVIMKETENEQTVLVRDSLGNVGEDGDEATLTYITSESAYRVDAVSGVYTVQFYVKGTYTTFEESKTNLSGVGSVNLKVSVNCSFTDKTVTLSIGSTYDLAAAFNISLDELSDKSKFTINITSGSAIVAVDSTTDVVSTLGTLGNAVITVKYTGNDVDSFPGMSQTSVTVYITVDNTFTLNISETTLAVGSSVYLYGVIGTNEVSDSSQFVWSTTNSTYVSLSDTTGQYVTATAKSYKSGAEEQTVTLAWTDTNSVTWVASCVITITSSATSFTISGDNELEVGDIATLTTNITTTQEILWMSSDTSILTVAASSDTLSAVITAVKNTGDAVVTAVNLANNAYATFKVTVTAPITSVTIQADSKTYTTGSTYTITSAVAYAFLSVSYTPTNATSTDMTWTSSKTDVATIDSNGMVTVKSEGSTYITVTPTYNPNGVSAYIILEITDDPITAIKTDVTKLSMVKGETYEVSVTLTPTNPTDSTLTWTSSDTSVASVKNGVITAVAAGTATILVEGGKATPVMIAVTVRDKLSAISFDTTHVEMEVGDTYELTVTLSPSTNVNTTLTFSSTDTSVVKVSSSGVLTAVSEGIAMITCIAEDLGSEGMITCTVVVSEAIIDAEDFSISPTDAEIRVGQSFSITPTFLPSNTSDQTVTYESMDEDIAMVNEDGVVTGIARGETIIYCTAEASGLSDFCYVTVTSAVTLTLSDSSKSIPKGQSYKITATVSPESILEDGEDELEWESSNEKIATVNQNGKVTAKKKGTCTIKCTLVYSEVSAKCTITVTKKTTTITLNKTSIRMNLGATYTLKATVDSNSLVTPTVTYTSKNKKIATVGEKSGRIKAKKVGATVITATTSDGKKARCRVVVIRRATSISLNKSYAICYVGSTIKLKATVKPSNASISTVKWTSSDKTIASVSGGKVTGYSAGEAYITAKTTDGSNKKAQCLVKVEESVSTTSVVVAQSELTMKVNDTAKLSYTVLPDNHTDSIKMASDNKRVAKVTNKGKVTAVGTGEANITITAGSGVTSSVTVHVVKLNKSSVTMRQYDTETLTVIGTSDTVTWYSENNRIATVSGGKITGKSIGTTYVYAYVNGCKLGCKVTITSVSS